MDRYDYIITGAGAAGLSLLIHIVHSGKFNDKKILLIDKAVKNTNDRTWCFWEKERGLFEEVVFKRWSSMWFHDKSGSGLHDILPYQYKLIRGVDFYNYCFSVISSQENIEVKYGNVENCVSDVSGTYVIMDGQKIAAEYIFNSILFEKPVLSAKQNYLLQHFKGWVIEADEVAFNAMEATLMDFRVEQMNGNTTFVYVMPYSENMALVEYTVFSKAVLGDKEYDKQLHDYIRQVLNIPGYNILEEESGSIPMTDYKFPKRINNIINIGTVGGQTKPSSGYTFHFIQKHSKAIVEALIKTGKPIGNGTLFSKRFDLYDRTLLNILSNHLYPGEKIFSTLMNSNSMKDVMTFLDNESSFIGELKIIRKLPKKIFLRSAFLPL